MSENAFVEALPQPSQGLVTACVVGSFGRSIKLRRGADIDLRAEVESVTPLILQKVGIALSQAGAQINHSGHISTSVSHVLGPARSPRREGATLTISWFIFSEGGMLGRPPLFRESYRRSMRVLRGDDLSDKLRCPVTKDELLHGVGGLDDCIRYVMSRSVPGAVWVVDDGVAKQESVRISSVDIGDEELNDYAWKSSVRNTRNYLEQCGMPFGLAHELPIEWNQAHVALGLHDGAASVAAALKILKNSVEKQEIYRDQSR